MGYQRQAIYWLVILIAVILAIGMLRQVLLPFVAAVFIAYFLNPLVDWLSRRGLPRSIASLLFVVVAGAAVAAALVFLMPIVYQQLSDLVQNMPQITARLRAVAEELALAWLGTAPEEMKKTLDAAFSELSQQLAHSTGSILSSALSSGLAIISLLSLILITPVITFFLLLDWPRMVTAVDSWLPRDHADTVRRLAGEIDEVLSGFIRGQGTVCLLLGVYYAVGLSLIGLNNSLLIGLGAGLLCFIPFAGSITAMVIAVLVAAAQFWPTGWPILQVLGLFLAGQLIDANVLSPGIVGRRVKLHPVGLIFALFVFAYLFGFTGMLVAVPAAAATGVLVRFAIAEYLKSPLYHGVSAGDGARAKEGPTTSG